MTVIPRGFLETAGDLERRTPAARRHLLLLGHEGLHVLERWRLLRHLESPRETEKFI